jgi:hypothetical protein
MKDENFKGWVVSLLGGIWVALLFIMLILGRGAR